MKTLKLIYLFFCGLFVFSTIMAITGCPEVTSSTDQKQTKQTEQLMSEANRQIGMPNIVNFQQRKLLKMVQELCDQENLITYTYIKNEMTGKLVFLGKSIGYGVPFSAQFTNPERIADWGHNVGYAILPQPDPNGLFMPSSSSATWVMLFDEATQQARPVYIESEITVSPFKLSGPAVQALPIRLQ